MEGKTASGIFTVLGILAAIGATVILAVWKLPELIGVASKTMP